MNGFGYLVIPLLISKQVNVIYVMLHFIMCCWWRYANQYFVNEQWLHLNSLSIICPVRIFRVINGYAGGCGCVVWLLRCPWAPSCLYFTGDRGLLSSHAAPPAPWPWQIFCYWEWENNCIPTHICHPWDTWLQSICLVKWKLDFLLHFQNTSWCACCAWCHFGS